MFDMVLNGFAMFWYPWPLALLNPSEPSPQLPTTKLYKTNRWETWEVQRILATHHGFHHFPSCFQTGLVQTSSILVLDHPWFNSLVPCLTWFWMVLLCFDTPGLWHCWTLSTTKPYKTSWLSMTRHEVGHHCSHCQSVALQLEWHLGWEQGKRMRNMRSSKNFSQPSWFPPFPIMFSNRSCPNLFYFSTGPPLVLFFGAMFDMVLKCFWMVLLCFDTPGPWHCWTHLNPPHNKTIQNQLMNLTHPSWFPIIF